MWWQGRFEDRSEVADVGGFVEKEKSSLDAKNTARFGGWGKGHRPTRRCVGGKALRGFGEEEYFGGFLPIVRAFEVRVVEAFATTRGYAKAG